MDRTVAAITFFWWWWEVLCKCGNLKTNHCATDLPRENPYFWLISEQAPVLCPQVKPNMFTAKLTGVGVGGTDPSLLKLASDFVHTKVALISEERPRHLQGFTCSASNISPHALFPLTWDNTRPGRFTSSHSSCCTVTEGTGGHESGVCVVGWAQV